MQKPLIGFIGQGFVGKSTADSVESQGFTVVRYSLDEQYIQNKDQIKLCSVVFICLPTPTTPDGFDDSIVRNAMLLTSSDTTVVIKSTIVPSTTNSIAKEYPDRYVMHAPEFLRAQNAAYDAANPQRNIIGIAEDTDEYKARAQFVLSLLPKAPYTLITTARNAECIKYLGNCFLYTKVVFMNLAHDFVEAEGASWDIVREATTEDPRIGKSHTDVFHEDGRGAGGFCFIKDFETFVQTFERDVKDEEGKKVLHALRDKNNKLLKASGKDLDLLEGVYGKKD